MEYGWADSAPGRLRSRLPNLNLLPAELLPVPIPWLTAGLVLLALGLVMLLYALFYMRSYTDLEIAAYRGRLATAEQAARELGVPTDASQALGPGVLEDWAELKARQVDWAAVMRAATDQLPPSVAVTGLTQVGYTVSLTGDAASPDEANRYLQRLRDSGLFNSLEMTLTGQEQAGPQPPAAAATPPVLTPQGQGSPTIGPPNQAVPPQVLASATPTIPIVFPPPPPSSTPRPPQPTTPPQPPATLAPRTPLATPTPLGAVPTVAATQGPVGTPTVAPTNTPAFDFVVQSKRETVDPNAIGNNSAVRIRVIDAAGNLVPGLRAHIDSQGDPPWSTDLPREGGASSNGTFEFPVGMGKFTVYVANGSSERATDLFTGVQGQPGVHVWDVTFRKMIPGTPAAEPVCTGCSPTPTPTWTLTPAPTATPISVGRNVAGFACATTSANQGDAFKAIDGDVNTGWDSGQRPVQQLSLDYQRYASSDSARACQPVAAGGTTSYLVEAVEMVTQMSGNSKITVELWALYDDNTSALLNTFADVDAFDNMTLSYRLPTPRAVKTVVVRTIRSNVNVAWREIRLFEPLPPAIGTWTPTPTFTPTFAAQLTPTPTQPSSQTIQVARPTASSDNNGANPASAAVDGQPDTFWRPVTGATGQYIDLNFSGSQTVAGVRFTTALGESIATATATVGPSTPTSTPVGASYRVVILKPSASSAQSSGGRNAQDVDCFASFSTADRYTIQGECNAVSGATGVRIYVDPQNSAFPGGVREVTIYAPAASPTPGTPTPSFTTVAIAAGCASPTSTPTGTRTPTTTAARSSAGRAAAADTPTDTPTKTPTPTATGTATVPAGLDCAQGKIGNANASDFQPTHEPYRAVDQTAGSAPVQDASTWWQASGPATADTTRSWSIVGLGGISVRAVQAQVYMPSPANASITLRLLDASGSNTLRIDMLRESQLTADGEIVGMGYPTPVTGVGQVNIIYNNVLVAPGLRTVSVYAPVAARASNSRMFDPLGLLADLLRVSSAHAAPLDQGYPIPGASGAAPSQPPSKPDAATPTATPFVPPPQPLPPTAGVPVPAKPGQQAPPQGQPNQPSAPLTGNPFPSAPQVAAPAVLTPTPQPVSLAPQPRPGRVGFLIIGKVRPGAPS